MVREIKREETPEETHFFDGLGDLWIKRCSHGVTHFRYAGVVSGGFFAIGLAEVRRSVQDGGGSASLFVDASELKDYAPEFREQWVTWFRGNRKLIRKCAMLHRSVLVKLGMSVANVALGGILQGFSSPEAFQQEFEATLASRRPPAD